MKLWKSTPAIDWLEGPELFKRGEIFPRCMFEVLYDSPLGSIHYCQTLPVSGGSLTRSTCMSGEWHCSANIEVDEKAWLSSGVIISVERAKKVGRKLSWGDEGVLWLPSGL